MERFFDLSGKQAVVTGAGSGIGAAIARRFARAGARVAIWEFNVEAGEAVASEIRRAGGEAVSVRLDVADAAAVEAAAAGLWSAAGRIDILVNNAGVSSVGSVENTPPEELDRLHRVNVAGVANGLRAVAPRMARAGGGAILNLASIASLVGVKDRFAYSASKGAIAAMTFSVAIDYASAGVRCNAVAPARIHTPFVDGFLAKHYPGREQETFAKLSAYQPVGRMGTPDEVAALAHYLCSDEASFVTGTIVPIDGGVCSMPGYAP